MQESQHVASILLSAHSIQQPLVVIIAQNPIPQVVCEFLVERPCPLLVFNRVQFASGPERKRPPQQIPSGSG